MEKVSNKDEDDNASTSELVDNNHAGEPRTGVERAMTVEGSGEQRVCYGAGGGTRPLNDQDFLSVTSL